LEHSIEICSKISCINDVRFFLANIFKEASIKEDNFNRVFLALSEAVNNAIVHGNLQNDSKRVFIKVLKEQNDLYFEVLDEGKGFILECIGNPTCLNSLKNEKGRGIFLIRQIADEVNYSEGGRKVSIKFKLN
jgi:serine/threonine-protein kinase RsbW